MSAAFLEELRALGPPVEGVQGNMDEAALKDSLPRERVVEVDGARIGMLHNPGPRAGREAMRNVGYEFVSGPFFPSMQAESPVCRTGFSVVMMTMASPGDRIS